MKILNIFGIRKRVILNHFENGYVIMEAITDEQHKKLKDEKNAKGQCSFKSDDCYIAPADIIVYGDVNLKNPNDCSILKKMKSKLLSDYPHFIHTQIDYKTGDIYPCEERQSYLMTETFDVIKWIKYNLLYLGNPENIIVYKVPIRYVKEHCPAYVRR